MDAMGFSYRHSFTRVSSQGIFLLCLVFLVPSGCIATHQGYLAHSPLDNVLEYIHRRDYDTAESLIKDMLRRDPTDASAWHQLGAIYLTVEDYAAARKAFEESLRQDPEYYEAQAELWAVKLLESGNKEEVKEAVRQEIKAFVSRGKVSIPRLMAAYQGRTYLHDKEAGRELAERILALEKEGITSFTEVTEEAGLSGIEARRVAWGDYDGDGFEDLLLNGKTLMQNQGDGTFRDVTQEAGIPKIAGARGGVWADFNNDGFLDFYTFASGRKGWDRFLKNNGDGTFKDITKKAVQEPDRYPTEAAAWGDYDQDGFVDLYVANYERPLHTTVELSIGTPDRLWHNNGDETFSDVARRAGTVSREKMVGRGVGWGDYNNDGLLDILVSNYRLDPNFLWENLGDGTFTNVAAEGDIEGKEVKGYFGNTIGSVWGDYDNDGDLDLFYANLAHPQYIDYQDKSRLLENLGPPDYHFVDRFLRSGIRYEESHADPSFIDYDNDGFLDLHITSFYAKRNSFLYQGNGRGTFKDVSYLAGVRVSNGWGNAFADMDNDGDLDLIVGTPDGVRLFRNNGNAHSWLQVKVVGSLSNRSGIGSRVSVVAGPLRQIREVEGGKGAGSQHSLITAFGFGDYRGTISVEVRFPSGRIVTLKRVTLNQRIVVEEK